MADKPSRALVIYGDGLASTVLPSHKNLHSFALRAACGFLSLRASPPAETEDERIGRDLAQLLDSYDFYMLEKSSREGEQPVFQTLSERFMGLKAAIMTSCQSIQSFCRKLGLQIVHENELNWEEDSEEYLDSFDIASKALRLLGFSKNAVLENCDFDLVFVHIAACNKPSEDKDALMSDTSVNVLDDLVGKVLERAHLSSAIGSRLHLSVVLSYECGCKDEKLCSLLPSSSIEISSDLSLLRPIQSYTMKGGHKLDDIRHHHPMLVGQWQEGVTRRDAAKVFVFEDFKENGGNLAILCDRFLHEVAFKLWKAPKYGA